MSLCTCPTSASGALPTVPNASCPFDLGQIQKIAFTKIFSTGITKNSFTTTAAIDKLASWQTKLTANDGTKIVLTSYVENPTPDGGDAITFGGGNNTVGGVVKNIGRNPVNMTFALRQYCQDIIAALKGLQGAGELGVFFFNHKGEIIALQDPSVATTYYPIPINSLFVGDLMPRGLEEPDDNTLSFSFAQNWSDNVTIVVPDDFNPLTDLENN